MYKKLSLALRMEEGNLILRPIGFEYAKSKTRFGQPQCSLLANYAENYSSILWYSVLIGAYMVVLPTLEKWAR